MRKNALREHISAGNTAVNAWMSLNSTYAAEVLSHAGFDSVTIDAQHGMLGREGIVQMLQAVSAGPATPMVRPSSLNSPEIGWLLDAGAYGIIAPSTDTAELAQELVAACFYPPFGRRSFGPSRGLLYGGQDYLTASMETIMPWAMIESSQALKNLDAILSTEGLYGVYVGPNDLALDLGLHAGGPISAEIFDIACTVAERAHHHGLAAGIFCGNGTEARKLADAGFDLVTPGNDVSFLRNAAQDRIETTRLSSAATTQTGGGY
ncbi:4-hydroxy-2-oxo-heptane-1,7-dioate aldolase [Arthrobacter ulcerisalmonis]|uniref:4-hydroxy-2-oxo-heptane-1,7-dioate aldolase n=1 Tax=Arthrobacter ulcerisalmonis TaxID=2483813 RepID=A0A3P5WUC9_9MICC|nr:aldolase/citrate lyase family protein [Arthrobacter ulcerisalmonis]VDC18460.1 4-hydroxy-2-oxo-heptane-1,7-dioate aldolase [Arthrobacter ulcerisalmonis]